MGRFRNRGDKVVYYHGFKDGKAQFSYSCPTCGHSLKENDEFCNECGTVFATSILTREDIEKVMREFLRRLKMDIDDLHIPPRYIKEEINCRMQGVYGTIMALVPNSNWQDCVWWLDEELEKIYNQFDIIVLK